MRLNEFNKVKAKDDNIDAVDTDNIERKRATVDVVDLDSSNDSLSSASNNENPKRKVSKSK